MAQSMNRSRASGHSAVAKADGNPLQGFTYHARIEAGLAGTPARGRPSHAK